MAEPQNKELDAFLAFFSTFNLHRSIATVADLSDGAGLLEILSIMCGDPPTLPSLLTSKTL
jgi:protein HOOK3